MNRYDLVMFDMDGTLMDSKVFHQEVFYRFLNEYVKPVTREEVEKRICRDSFKNWIISARHRWTDWPYKSPPPEASGRRWKC